MKWIVTCVSIINWEITNLERSCECVQGFPCLDPLSGNQQADQQLKFSQEQWYRGTFLDMLPEEMSLDQKVFGV